MRKYKLGIYGSGVAEKEKVTKKAKALGKLLGKFKDNLILINGACTGIPYQVVSEASKEGVEIYGYSSAIDFKSQKELTPQDDLTVYKKLIFTPLDFEFSTDIEVVKKYRNVISTANCDAAIIISGRWGTMNEFTNLYDMGKVIGVLTETGGIADELPLLCRKINKKSPAKVFFHNSPSLLLKKVLEELRSKST